VAQAAKTPSGISSADWKKYSKTIAYLVALILFLLWIRPMVADQTPARLVNVTVTGLLIGGIYGLVAVGIVIINKASGVFNFAHGYMMYFSALVFYSFFTVANINVWAAAALSIVTVVIAISLGSWRDLLVPRNLLIGAGVVIVLTLLMTVGGPELRMLRALTGGVVTSVLMGLIIERFTIRPLIGQPLFAIVLMTLAIDRILAGITQLVWGSSEKLLDVFAGLAGLGVPATIRLDTSDTFLQGQLRINQSETLVAFVLALVAFGAFVVFFRYTSVGLAMRATAENQRLAQSVGLRVRVVLAVAWSIAGLLALTAGVLQGGAATLEKGMPLLALRAFPAVLLGGLESIGGALLGGFAIGIVQEWANLLFQGTDAGTELAPYVVLMIVLIIRPDGLFGQKRIERI